MKMYKVALQIDTGYEWLNRTCILYANSKENAALKANTYINSCLLGDSYATVKNVEEVNIKYGIVYQDCFQKTVNGYFIGR